MTDDDERRSRAKLNAAIDSMKDALRAASDALHEISFEDDEEAEFSRLIATGELVENVSMLCGHDINVLNLIAFQLLAIHDGDDDVVAEEERPHLH
jgi:hypothetical protein